MTTKISASMLAESSGVKITSLTYPNSATAADPAGSETITVTGSGFNSGANVYIDTTLCTTTYVSSTSLTFTSPAKSAASYNIIVYNTDGSSGVKPAGILYSAIPVWVTSSGALTNAAQNTSYSQSVSATGDTIVYSLTSGSLPSGLSLNTSTGAITGTAPNTQGTSNFTITATDAQNQAVARSFSITVAGVPSEVEYLVVAGGGGGGGGTTSPAGSGGGAGGFRTATGFAVASGVALTVTVGGGGTAGTGTSPIATKGSDSVFSTITSTGGGAGAYYLQTFNSAIHSGGSGGGATWNSGTAGSGNTPPTTPSQGNNGGGIGTSSGQPSSGGGGAGGAGTAYGSGGGAGGAGVASSITGASVTYAGGGGGGAGIYSTPGGTATGGGGAGGNTGVNGTAGTANTGGGGGGAGEEQSGTRTGGNGGSGVVIIRYADSFAGATSTTNLEAGYPVVSGGYRVYKWITSGSITF